MADTYNVKYQQNFEKDSKCNVFNDAQFSGPVTINAGKAMSAEHTNEKIKEAIESMFKDGTVTNENQWFAIKRVLTDKNIAPKKLGDFLAYLDSLKLEGVIPYNNENVKKVGLRCTRLSVDVSAWSTLRNQSDAEQSQVLVATKMMALLQ